MYHAYNLISHEKNGIAVSHLPLMLEGQVAVLSSGYLETNESISVLDNLKEVSCLEKINTVICFTQQNSCLDFLKKI